MTFKNQAEIFQALLEGKKLCNVDWTDEESYIHMVDGIVCYNSGQKISFIFEKVHKWKLYEEPKPEKREAREFLLYDYGDEQSTLFDPLKTSLGSFKVREVLYEPKIVTTESFMRDNPGLFSKPKSEKKTETWWKMKFIKGLNLEGTGWYASKKEALINNGFVDDECVLAWESIEVEI